MLGTMAPAPRQRTSSHRRRGATAVALVGIILVVLLTPTEVSAPTFERRLAVCDNGNVHYSANSHWIRSKATGSWSSLERDGTSLLMAGSDGRVYQRDGVKMDCEGRVLGQAPTRDLMSDTQLHVVQDENGRFLYFWPNGFVDSQNVLHVIPEPPGLKRYRQIAPNETVTLDVALGGSIPSSAYLFLGGDSQGQLPILYRRYSNTTNQSDTETIYYAKINRQGSFVVNATEIVATSAAIQYIAAVLGPDDRLYFTYGFYGGGGARGPGPFFVRVGPDGSREAETDLLPGSGTGSTEVWGMGVGPGGDLHLIITWSNATDPRQGYGSYYVRLDTSGRILEGPVLLRSPNPSPSLPWPLFLIVLFIPVIAWAFYLTFRRPRQPKGGRRTRFWTTRRGDETSPPSLPVRR